MGTFDNQIAVVTGASSGIGRAIALGLATKGAALCLVGRRAHELEEVSALAQATSSCARIYCVDLSSDQEVERLKSELERDCRQLDILVHSAGIFRMGSLERAPATDLDIQYCTNVRAPYLLTQALLPMLRPRRGQIVFINSSVGLVSRINVSQYAATKSALKAIADSLRDEVNADGLRVLSVYPGRTATAQQEDIYKQEGREYRPELLLQPADVAAVVLNALGLERTAEVTDISIRPLRKS